MALTDNQIERYSRQIIVPGVGGRAQERLLASCVAIVAGIADAASALAYLAGAGVGRIVMYPVGDWTAYRALIERISDLNPETNVHIASDKTSDTLGDVSGDTSQLMLALVGDALTAEAAARVWRASRTGVQGAPKHRSRAAIIARLDTPGRIALFPAPPPCPLCADADLLSPPDERAYSAKAIAAGAIAMVAVAEAFKLLAGLAGRSSGAQLVEFNGYVSAPRALGRRRLRGGGGSK
ncbi:MAG: hypothetical protein ACREPW_10130, partial [Candidatus Binataceae bacterium]